MGTTLFTSSASNSYEFVVPRNGQVGNVTMAWEFGRFGNTALRFLALTDNYVGGNYTQQFVTDGTVRTTNLGKPFDFHFSSAPVAEQVTISGTVILSCWGYESSMQANMSCGMALWAFSPDTTTRLILNSRNGIEFTTTNSSISWNATPTPTTLYPGDILVAVAYFTDADGTSPNSGFTVQMSDVRLQFTETISFNGTPTGTQLYMLNTPGYGSASGVVRKELSTTAPTATSQFITNVTPYPYKQMTDTAGGLNVEWITERLSAATVQGMFSLNYDTASFTKQNSIYLAMSMEIYKTDSSGDNQILVGVGALKYSTPNSMPGGGDYFRGHIRADISQGERLKVSLFYVFQNTNLATMSTSSSVPLRMTLPSVITALPSLPPIVIDVSCVAAATIGATVQAQTIGGSVAVAGHSVRVDEQFVIEAVPNYYTAYYARDGDYILCGCQGIYNTVFVLYKSAGVWTLQQNLSNYSSPPSAGNTIYYGYGVQIEGSIAAISAYSGDWWNTSRAGAVYIWSRTGSTWSEIQRIAAGSSYYSEFGKTISMSGNTLAISDNYGTTGYPDYPGSVHIYTRTTGTFSLQTILYHPIDAYNNASSVAGFGASLSLSGDTLVVLAINYRYNDLGYTDGVCFVYTRSGTTWSLQQAITGAPHQTVRVAVSGDRLLITKQEQDTPFLNPGDDLWMEVWTRTGTTWSHLQDIMLSTTITSWGSFSNDGDRIFVDTTASGTSPPLFVYQWNGSEYVLAASIEKGAEEFSAIFEDPDPNKVTLGTGWYSPDPPTGMIRVVDYNAYRISHDSYASPPTIQSTVVSELPSLSGTVNASVNRTTDVTSSVEASRSSFGSIAHTTDLVFSATASVARAAEVALNVGLLSSSEAVVGTVVTATVSLIVDVASSSSATKSSNASIQTNIGISSSLNTSRIRSSTATLAVGVTRNIQPSVLHAPPPNDTPETAVPIAASPTSSGWYTYTDGREYIDAYENGSNGGYIYTDQATTGVGEPGGVTSGTVWWVLDVDKITSYTFNMYTDQTPQVAMSVYDSNYNLVATDQDSTWTASVQVMLRPGRYYIQGWFRDGASDGLWLEVSRIPFILNHEITEIQEYNPGESSMWGIHGCKVTSNVALFTWSESPGGSMDSLMRAVAVSVGSDLNYTVGPAFTYQSTGPSWADEALTLHPLGDNKVLALSDPESGSGNSWGTVLHVDSALNISVVNKYGVPETVSYSVSGAVADPASGNSLILSEPWAYWGNRTGQVERKLMSDSAPPGLDLFDLATEVINRYVFRDGQCYTFSNGSHEIKRWNIDWATRTVTLAETYPVSNLGHSTWYDYGDIVDSEWGINVLAPKTNSPDVMQVWPSVLFGETVGTPITFTGDYLQANYGQYYDGDFLIRFTESEYLVLHARETSGNSGFEQWKFWNGIRWVDVNFNEWAPPAYNSYNFSGLPLVDVGKGLFVCAWLKPGDQACIRVGAYTTEAAEPPPLKMTQRDDGRMGGTQRLGYTPQNGDSQRIGWQAY